MKTLREYMNSKLEGHLNTLSEDKVDDEMLRVDIANNFINKFADEFAFNRANLQSQLVGNRQMIKINIGKGTKKVFAGQIIIEYPSRDKYKISRYDGLFSTADMKKWATKEFGSVFKDELKKGKIR